MNLTLSTTKSRWLTLKASRSDCVTQKPIREFEVRITSRCSDVVGATWIKFLASFDDEAADVVVVVVVVVNVVVNVDVFKHSLNFFMILRRSSDRFHSPGKSRIAVLYV